MMALHPVAAGAMKIVLTLGMAFAAATLCVAWHTPLPWMIGPLLITAALSILGMPTRSWTPLRNSAQWAIGAALGMYFTPQVSTLVVSLWWVVGLSILWSLMLGYGFGWCLYWYNAPRFPGLDRVTTYFASLIGGASEMTLLSERERARTDLVAAAHSLRILLVTITVPVAMQWSGWHGVDVTAPVTRLFDAVGLLQFTLITGAGAVAMKLLRRSNPWFLGPLVVSIALATHEITLSGLPVWLTNAAQLVIGVSLGVRFTPGFLHTAPRWLLSVALGTLCMIGLCALSSLALSALTDLPLATLILASAPGGIAEMAITAKVLQLGVAVVTALQACRVIAVLFLADPLFQWLRRRRLI